jgi:hypothetical protein
VTSLIGVSIEFWEKYLDSDENEGDVSDITIRGEWRATVWCVRLHRKVRLLLSLDMGFDIGAFGKVKYWDSHVS